MPARERFGDRNALLKVCIASCGEPTLEAFLPSFWPWFIPPPCGRIGPHSDAIRVCQELPFLLPFTRWTPSFVKTIRFLLDAHCCPINKCIVLSRCVSDVIWRAGRCYGCAPSTRSRTVSLCYLLKCRMRCTMLTKAQSFTTWLNQDPVPRVGKQQAKQPQRITPATQRQDEQVRFPCRYLSNFV